MRAVTGKFRAWMEVGKVRLALMVAFTGVCGAISEGCKQPLHLFILFLGGLLLTYGNISINQYIERDSDALMVRTMKRPIPSGIIMAKHALIAGIMAIIAGVILLFSLSAGTAALGLFSTIVYLFLYTPLKKVTPASVILGGIAGALPPLIGSYSVSNLFTETGLFLFAGQYGWQLPHSWVIALYFADDYKSAGFKILPSSIPLSRINRKIVTLSIALFSASIVLPPSLVINFNPIFTGLNLFLNSIQLVFTMLFFSKKQNKYLIFSLLSLYFHLVVYQISFIIFYGRDVPLSRMFKV